MIIELTRRYTAECAHRLTAGVPEGHMCRRLHGHMYVIEISVAGEVAPDGMLAEYGLIDRIVKPVVGLINHHDLNTLDARCSTPAARAVAENPTVELLLHWLVERSRLLGSARPGFVERLSCIRIQEDPDSWVTWPPRARP